LLPWTRLATRQDLRPDIVLSAIAVAFKQLESTILSANHRANSRAEAEEIQGTLLERLMGME
jgi:gamma-glutamyl phosphate reductase